MRKKWKRGSLTIEAACVMSVVLFTLMGSLYLFFFVHNRAWLTAAACEAAVSGSMEGARAGGAPLEAALEKGRELGNTGFFGGEKLHVQADAGKKVQVVYDLDVISGFGGFSWHLRAEGNAAAVRPAAWIRRTKAAAELIGGQGGK